MKNSKYFIFLIGLLSITQVQAQDVGAVVQKYQAAIANIESIHCQVEQLDTFVTGDTWHYKGQLTLLRNPADSLFGFDYRAVKEVGDEALYDGLSEFQIDHKAQTYELNTQPKSYILGSPGGQLVVPELIQDQHPDLTPGLIETEQYFVLRYTFPDLEEYDVRQREKKVFLDKTTFLPIKVISRQVTLDKKQVLTRVISEMQINQPENQERFQKDFLSDYEMLVEEQAKDPSVDLLKTKVKDFSLETFTGADRSTRPQAGRLLLLDFWEVWCGPCVESMPKVQQLADQYGEKGLEVVGVLMDPNSRDSAQRLIQKKRVDFTQTLGSPELRSYFRVFAIPQYILIDQNGIIQHIYRGYDSEMETHIKQFLAKAK